MAIVVTGAAGFIGSCLVGYINSKGYRDLILVDDFSHKKKYPNLQNKHFIAKIDRGIFLHDLHRYPIEFIFHLGARTDTTEFDNSIFEQLNYSYSKLLWTHATENNIPFLYASSAATYGDGENGFDDTSAIRKLTPLNPYGHSKHKFDLWVEKQKKHPPFWVGLKFFNVFGPNEYHKGRMASVVMHAYHQIRENGQLNLFASHHPNYKNGEQMRDFIYIKDLLSIMWFWFENPDQSGIYNAGSGNARSFNDLAFAIFTSLNIEPQINYVPTPIDIRDKYQYYTQATMNKISSAGYKNSFYTLEEAVDEYINDYLIDTKIF